MQDFSTYLKRNSILKEGKKRIKNFISRLENRDVNNDWMVRMLKNFKATFIEEEEEGAAELELYS